MASLTKTASSRGTRQKKSIFHSPSTQRFPSGSFQLYSSRNPPPPLRPAKSAVTPSQPPACSKALAETLPSSEGLPAILSHIYFRRLYCQVRLADYGHPAVSLNPVSEIPLE